MDLEKYRNIKGIDEFFKYFPDKPWCHFHDVLEFRYYMRFDYEEWIERTYIDLVMTDIERKDGIVLHCIDAYIDGSCEMWPYISGLDIICLKSLGYETKYKIVDFEDNSINIYCDDIEISIVDPDQFIYS